MVPRTSVKGPPLRPGAHQLYEESAEEVGLGNQKGTFLPFSGKAETDRQPAIEGWDEMPNTDLMRPASAQSTGRPATPSALTRKLTYGLKNDQKCWSSLCATWGPVPRPLSANNGERTPNQMEPPGSGVDHSKPTSFPRSGRPCSAGTLGQGFRDTVRRTPLATTTWERGGPRGGTPIGSICQQLHLIKATKGQYAGLTRIIGKPGGGCGGATRSPRSRKEQRRDSEDSDDYFVLPTADPNRRLSDYERGLRSQQIMKIDHTRSPRKDEEDQEEENQLGPRQQQEIIDRQQRYKKIEKQMEELEKQLDAVDAKLTEREKANTYDLSADIRRSAKHVRERINNLQRDLVVEEKLQPPPRKLPKSVLNQLDDEFYEVKRFIEHGAGRVKAIETRIFIQQKHVREGNPVAFGLDSRHEVVKEEKWKGWRRL